MAARRLLLRIPGAHLCLSLFMANLAVSRGYELSVPPTVQSAERSLPPHRATARRRRQLPGSAAVAAGNDHAALIQGSVHSRQESNSQGPDQGPITLDLDGCPAPRGYEEAFQRRCDASRLARRADCATTDVHRLGRAVKQVYFLRHALPECCEDCGLQRRGVEDCEGLKANNTLLQFGPLSEAKRAEIVYTSPATRAMETAIRIFGDLGAPIVIDRSLVEIFGFRNCSSCAMGMLSQTGHTELMRQYSHVFEDPLPVSEWEKNVRQRARRFANTLLSRPERRIVVVSHHGFLRELGVGMECMNMGETVAKAGLTEGGAFITTSELTCEGRRRRWPYGNWRRITEST